MGGIAAKIVAFFVSGEAIHAYHSSAGRSFSWGAAGE
jgi:hypothetical protein